MLPKSENGFVSQKSINRCPRRLGCGLARIGRSALLRKETSMIEIKLLLNTYFEKLYEHLEASFDICSNTSVQCSISALDNI